jgi:hypothetical protein
MEWVAANGSLTSDYPYEESEGSRKGDKSRNHVTKISGRNWWIRTTRPALDVAVVQQPVAVAYA